MMSIDRKRAAVPKPLLCSRGELFATLYVFACVNGLAGKVIASVQRVGWVDAAAVSFDISISVVVACFAGVSLTRVDPVPPRKSDLRIALLSVLVTAMPVAACGWLAVTLISFFRLSDRQPGRSAHRGAVILLAVTVPMLWSRMIFDFFARPILALDALLVGYVLGTRHSGNMVEFSDHSGTLVVFPACSSLANVSLALLCWVTTCQVVQHKAQAADFFWCALACVCVIALNVLRISFMGLSLSNYDMLHSAAGETVLNLLMLTIIMAISLLGVRRDLFSPS